MPSDKKQTNVRLSDEGRKLVEGIAALYNIDMTDVFEIAVRKYAQELGLWRSPADKRAEQAARKGKK